jgi:tetratricopeptide (TPR) repeat protein
VLEAHEEQGNVQSNVQSNVQGTWFAVRGAGGASTYVAGGDVQVLPRRVEAAQRDVQLREGPGLTYPSQAQVDLQGDFAVLDRQYQFGQGIWYRLQVGDRMGCVQGDWLQPRWLLPVEHFMAGLTDYRGWRFESAHREFTQFINTPNVVIKSVNLAVAYQLQGASRLSFQVPLGAVESPDLSAFSKAIDLTPYDPAAYNLRALARFGATRRLDDVLADLKHALDLEPENVQARAFTKTLVEGGESGAIDLPDLEWLAAFIHLERIRLGPHQRLPTNATALGPRADGNGSVMTLENRTATALRLYLVGPVSRIVELPQGQSQAIDLAEGKYALAAEFSPDAEDAPLRVRPMYSVQTYAPQTRYALKFYVQWRHRR